MNKKLIITALCLSVLTPMMAQNITGKVMNTKGEPLAFANVVLLNTPIRDKIAISCI